jgi:cytochrome c oxidase cbb3-type subunit 3
MKFQGLTKQLQRACLLLAGALFANYNVFAAGPPVPSEAGKPLAIILLVVIIALLLVIGLLAYVLLGAAEISLERSKQKTTSANVVQALVVAGLCLFSSTAFAQDAASATAPVAATDYGGISAFSYYALITIIGLEVTVIMVMLYHVKALLAKEKIVIVVEQEEEAAVPRWKLWWEKMNSFKPAHEVVDTGHDYDGIRELDNKLPPWWLYGLYLCIVFAVVYIYRFELAHTAPSTLQEYEIAVAKAEVEKEEYLKHAANKVDENTVTLMTDVAALADGKKLFGSSCAPCHGPDGQGVVGPNLTDDYWLHKGGVKDVFKTIKYGVPEKGMKSWKDDFNPNQIAQLASYIKSLHGSKPANAKEPQGELYKDDPAAIDSTKTKSAIAAR